MAFCNYAAVGGSRDGVILGFPEKIESGSMQSLPMRLVGPSGERLEPDGRYELYMLESDGKFYFMNVITKNGERVTLPGTHEPSRIIDGKHYFDYRFVGGSHDGGNRSYPCDFKVGHSLILDMRGAAGLLLGGKQEVFKLEADRRFHYQNIIMRYGQQISPPA